MHIAKLMTQGSPPPDGTILIGYIDKHPADRSGLGYAVLFFAATGVEMAWDGQCCRSLPRNWRTKVTLTPVNPTVALGRLGGSVSSEAKAAAARENGKRGGRPKKHRSAK